MCSVFLRHWWAVCWCSFSSAAVLLFSSLTPLSFSQGVSGDADATSCRGESVSVPLSSHTSACKLSDSLWIVSLTRFLLCVRVKPVGPSNVLSMAQLRTLPLGEQVKTLMKNGRITWLRTAFDLFIYLFFFTMYCYYNFLTHMQTSMAVNISRAVFLCATWGH